MSESNEKVYGYVTEKILALLREGVAPWKKPWKGGGGMFPKNIRSKKPYRGSNVILLWAASMVRDFHSPWWGTWKAWEEKGGVVRPEEKKNSDFVTFFNMVPIYTEETKHLPKEQREVAWYKPFLRYWRVWNSEQLENERDIIPAPLETVSEFIPVDGAQAYTDAYIEREGIVLDHEQGRAFYRPSNDMIGMPSPNTFDCPEEYYSTLFHEEVHSTGNEKRLNRKEGMTNVFGDHLYSLEELVAEMGAAMMCAVCEIETVTIENSAAYIQSWISKLESNPKWVVQAGGKAQKAVDYMLGVSYNEKEED